MTKLFLDANFLIYLNTMVNDQHSKLQKFFSGLLNEELFTDLLVIEETLYISFSKYNVPYQLTLEFLKNAILPYAAITPMEESDISLLGNYLSRYPVKPSDAVHLACMEKEGITKIISEDKDFDKVKEVTRLWLPKTMKPESES